MFMKVEVIGPISSPSLHQCEPEAARCRCGTGNVVQYYRISTVLVLCYLVPEQVYLVQSHSVISTICTQNSRLCR